MGTLEVSYNVHRQVKAKQVEIREKYGKTVTIKEITDVLILASIDRLEELLKLKDDELKENKL